MDTEILNTLETIRGYLFVIMVAIVVWMFFKILEVIMNALTRWLKAWDSHFISSANRMLDEGNYQEAVKYCKNKLSKQPNHADANWLIAKAYYFLQKNNLAVEHFKKSFYLIPSWEEDALVYIGKIQSANKSSNLTGEKDSPSS